MKKILKFENWNSKFRSESGGSGVNEMAKRPVACKINFEELRQSQIYADFLSLGFVEVNSAGVPRIDPIMQAGKTQAYGQVKHQSERQGSLKFIHPRLYPGDIIAIDYSGGVVKVPPVRVMWAQDAEGKRIPHSVPDIPQGQHRGLRAQEVFISNQKWAAPCPTVEEYKNRLEYMIKLLLTKEGFITTAERDNDEGGIEIIKRKIDEDAANAGKLKDIPASLSAEYDKLKKLANAGIFGL
jgi:hypothetical protein